MSLTPYKKASVRETLYIALPLMLNCFSSQFMLFCDRIVLSLYDPTVMGSATAAGTTFAIFEFAFIVLASMAEVFVGQYNGAKRFKMIAKPVWQMIYLCLFGYIICIPAFLGTHYLIPPEFGDEGRVYFKTLILFGPLYGIATALDAFYIGRGKTKFVTVVTVLANIINILLDIAFVFGIEGLIAPMGAMGAAIATNIATFVIAISIGIGFFCKKNHLQFGTRRPLFHIRLFKKMFLVGLPQAVNRIIEIGAWAFMFHYFAWASSAHVLVNSIAQTIFLMSIFISDALSKSVSTIASNLIGAKESTYLKKLLRSAFKIHIAIMLIAGIPLLLFPGEIATLFLKKADLSLYQYLHREVREVICYVWLFILFDGFTWVIIGILTAGGDTRFIMLTNSIIVWFGAVLPSYIAVIIFGANPGTGWAFFLPYVIANLVAFWLRYWSGKWQKLDLSLQKKQISPKDGIKTSNPLME